MYVCAQKPRAIAIGAKNRSPPHNSGTATLFKNLLDQKVSFTLCSRRQIGVYMPTEVSEFRHIILFAGLPHIFRRIYYLVHGK